MRNMIETNPHFLELVKNTLEDFQRQNVQNEGTKVLEEICMTKEVNLQTAIGLYTIMEMRKANISYVKKNSDIYSFQVVNEEHKYMDRFLNRFFKKHFYIEDGYLYGYVSLKMEEVA